MALDLPNMSRDASDALKALSSIPSGGLTPPDFSVGNQFKGAPLPALGVGGGAGGNPFSLTPGASQAATALMPQMGGQAGGGLGGAGNSLSQAANKLSSAADKISAAADKLSGLGGGPGGPGSPNMPTAPGAPALPSATPGVPSGAPQGGGGGMTFAGIGQQAFSTLGNAAGAALNRRFAVQTFEAAQQGIGSFYTQQARQERMSIAGGIGMGIGGAAGAFFGGPMGAMVGASAGQMLGNLAGNMVPTTADPADIKLATQQFGINRARAGVDVAAQTRLFAGTMPMGDARQNVENAAARLSLAQQTLGAAAGSAQASMRLSGLGEGAISPGGQRFGEGMGNYTAALGITRTQAMNLEADILSSGGIRGNMTADMRRTTSRMLSSGIGAGTISQTIAAERPGGAFSALTDKSSNIIRRANALGLVGAGAQDYVSAEIGFFQNQLDAGGGLNDRFQQGTESFIMRGRNLGISSFQGRGGFNRAQEMVGASRSAARSFGQMMGGGSSGYDTLLQSAALQASGGDTFAAYSALFGASPEEQIQMMQAQGVDSFTIQQMAMGKGLSPDTIKAMTEGTAGGALPKEGFGKRTRGAGAAGQAAALESAQVSAFDSEAMNEVIKGFGTLSKEISGGASLKDVQEAIKDTTKAINNLDPGAVTNPQELKRRQAKAAQIEQSRSRRDRLNDMRDGF